MNISQFIYRLKTWRKKPLVIIGGSTASGKTSCAIAIAQEFEKSGQKVEIISADSRQIYKGIPIFSGAVTEVEMSGITHHLVGTEDPAVVRSADWFRHEAMQLIEQIHNRGSIPVVAGGSAFWVQSLLFKDDYPQVDTNETLRKELELMTVSDLQARLQMLDPKRFASIDIENPRRLVRSIEIATALGYVPRMKFTPNTCWNTTLVYFDLDREVLVEKIKNNVKSRYNAGLIDEARVLSSALDQKRFVELGLAYKYMHSFWEGEMSEQELRDKTTTEEVRYAKRQKTFFKKILTMVWCRVHVIQNKEQRNRVIGEVVSRYI